MSVNLYPLAAKQYVLSLVRMMAQIGVVASLVLWSARSHADFAPINLGTYTFSDSVNRQAIDQPIVFMHGANPIETTQPAVLSWLVPWWPRAEAWSDAPRIPGRIVTVHGQPHNVFQIPGLSSIGYVLDVKDPASSTWLPINDQLVPPSTLAGRKTTYQIPEGAPGLCCTMGLSIRITFIKTDHRPIVNFSGQLFSIDKLVSFHTLHNLTTIVLRGPAHANLTFTLRKIASSCRMTSSSTQNIKLPDVPMVKFRKVGSTHEGGNEARFSLQCDPGTTVFATVTDANSPSNTSDTLTNTGSANGVGVQLLQTSPSFSASNCSNGSPCRFGPDSSAIGNTNQWQVGPNNTSNTAPTGPTISFRARYIRTGTVQPGTVRAISTITFSYQ